MLNDENIIVFKGLHKAIDKLHDYTFQTDIDLIDLLFYSVRSACPSKPKFLIVVDQNLINDRKMST